MKLMKYAFAFALALAFCASASVSQAAGSGTPVYVATGSSALFLELGQAATGLADTGCYWTHKTDNPNVAARDDRPTIPAGQTDEFGNIWVTWGPGTGTCAAPAGAYHIYSEMNLDSVLGQRCYFMVNAADVGGCIQIFTVASGTAGVGLLGTGFSADTALPNDVILSLANARMNAAATDIRPEDGKFASARMFTPCNATISRNPYEFTSFNTTGTGYQTGVTGIGTSIQDFTNPGTAFHVYDFNISGTDPIDGQALAGAGRTPYVVTTVGAQPVMVTVGPVNSTGIGAATDINFGNLSEFLVGGLGRATDLIGPTVANPVVAILREPLSGTYNTMEFSVPNSNEFKNTQELFNCNAGVVSSNPMNIPTAFGAIPNSRKIRTIGTGHMVAALINPAFCTVGPPEIDCIGYWFWSAGNAASFTAANQKYLTVNGVDPIKSDYNVSAVGIGVIPNSANAGLGEVTFKNLNLGDYPIWSALRIVSTSAAASSVTTLVNKAQTLNATLSDFVPVTSLAVWKSHFELLGLGVTNASNGATINPLTVNDLCPVAGASPENGGDAGGITLGKQANKDFCVDFNTSSGITDKNQ